MIFARMPFLVLALLLAALIATKPVRTASLAARFISPPASAIQPQPAKTGGSPTQSPLNCAGPGWDPADFDLKDHHVFRYNDQYYLVSIYLPGETQFAYARSDDLCNWEDLGPILTERVPGSWDEFRIWAPFVYEENGTYYMYFTGVTNQFTQSILFATTTNPADPASWQVQPLVFQPSHPDADWQAGRWSDCRDPSLFKIDGLYYLIYTGRDASGGIIGLASAASPLGPWTDWGSLLPITPGMYESATLTRHEGLYYLFYNHVAIPETGEYYRIGATPAGPWSPQRRFAPGWAHEIWPGAGGEMYVSYLTNLFVTIAPFTWDNFFSPAVPVIGAEAYHQTLPLVLRK